MKKTGTRWIQTFSGKQIDPLNPDPDDICIEDIAHALSMTCRYNGHCKYFYSVAEHSVIVSNYVPKELALYGLLHDASEAYISDVTSPVKPYLTGYGEIEARLQLAIIKKFELNPFYIDKRIKQADLAILHDEKSALFDEDLEWNLSGDGLGCIIHGLDWRQAAHEFLIRFKELTE